MPERFEITATMSSEAELIERIRRKFASTGCGVRTGIGDDAAVLRPAKSAEWIVTTDAFLENVHFLLRVHPPKAVGYKALARATSDLAAMGARPRYFLLTLGLPAACTKKWLDDFLGGMALAARRFGLILVGGDTTMYPTVVVTLTVIGEIDPGHAILRSGARPTDLICVSGRLGEAELGLRLVQQGLHKKRRWKNLARKHFYPEPRLALGEWLAKHRCATAMIDTSDGLSTDLGHICKASGAGARVWAEKIPVVRMPSELKRPAFDPMRLALDGGEDYELLFTVPRRLARLLPRKVSGVSVTVIGEVTRGKGIMLLDSRGRGAPLRRRGWDPFRQSKIKGRLQRVEDLRVH
jgi:thiamine-monophosphate kinase